MILAVALCGFVNVIAENSLLCGESTCVKDKARVAAVFVAETLSMEERERVYIPFGTV